MDGLPFKEGWSANPSQVSPYAVEWKAGLLYKNLSGSGWENEPYSGLSNPIGTATASIDFAQSYEEIQGTYLDPEGDKTLKTIFWLIDLQKIMMPILINWELS